MFLFKPLNIKLPPSLPILLARKGGRNNLKKEQQKVLQFYLQAMLRFVRVLLLARKSPMASPQLSSMLLFVRIRSVRDVLLFTRSAIPLAPTCPTELPIVC